MNPSPHEFKTKLLKAALNMIRAKQRRAP